VYGGEDVSLLEKSILDAPIVKKNDYNYIVHPITDGIPYIDPALLEEITSKMAEYIPDEVERIVTIEAMGIPLATAISLKLRKPFTIIRKREYSLPGEISVEQVTGYSKSKLFINGLEKGDKIAIVDDVLSTGGTLRAVLKALKEKEIDVRIVVIAIDKGTIAREIEKEFGVPVVSLASIEVRENETIIKSIKV